jgi:DNA-binding transcriptional ArsR family regulator
MQADAVFAALGDPTRRQVVELLAREPSVTATGLAAQLPISRQAVAKHLVVLRAAGLVHPSRVGRETRYALERETLEDAARWIERVGEEWDHRLGALRRSLSPRA